MTRALVSVMLILATPAQKFRMPRAVFFVNILKELIKPFLKQFVLLRYLNQIKSYGILKLRKIENSLEFSPITYCTLRIRGRGPDGIFFFSFSIVTSLISEISL